MPPLNKSKIAPPLLTVDRISNFFHFKALETDYRTELLASVTTFMTTAPILVVNAHILGNAIFLNQPGDLFEQILVALVLCSTIATILIGLSANYPITLAPGTGTAALFTFSIVLDMGMNWRLALTAVLVEGILFTALVFSPFRRHIIDSIPASLKQAMVVGLGLFLSYIALSGNVAPPSLGAGIIVASTATTTALGSLKRPATLIAIAGILFTAILTARRVSGVAPLPEKLLEIPQLPIDLVGQAIVGSQYLTGSQLGNFVASVFILLFICLADTISSLNVLGQQLDRVKPNGELHRSKQALLSNSFSTISGALLGSVPVIPYLDSAAGIFEGGRSGFVAIVVALLFLISAGFAPLFAAIPAFATAPVLLMIGVLMMSGVRAIDWNNLAEAIPAFLVILMMPLTFSIADGMAVGFIADAAIKMTQGKKSVTRSSLTLAGIAVAYFLLIALQS
jgi:adenine/guanine/hypoxanthine permease